LCALIRGLEIIRRQRLLIRDDGVVAESEEALSRSAPDDGLQDVLWDHEAESLAELSLDILSGDRRGTGGLHTMSNERHEVVDVAAVLMIPSDLQHGEADEQGLSTLSGRVRRGVTGCRVRAVRSS
jgi:hypothetical protein